MDNLVEQVYYGDMGLSAASKRSLLKKTHPAYAKEAQSMKNSKVHRVMKEYKMGKLHSGSKHGPMVRSRKQAIAIAMSEARNAT